MPANKNAMTRYKILDDLLSNRYHNYSLDDLTEEVSTRLTELYPNSNGVVRRTIEKDIRYLEYEGPFLVEIERYTVATYIPERNKTVAKQCLRYRHPGFSIFQKELTDDEEYLLSEALSLLGQFDGLPNLDALERLRNRLNTSHNKKIISFSKNPLTSSNLLGELFTAISQQQVIEITYQKFGTQQTSQAILYPYLLKEYNNRWFLLASGTDEKILCYGLERISKVTPMPALKYKEYKGDLNEYFEDIIGTSNYQDKTVEHIVFWVSDYSKDYIETKPIHESQKHYHGETEIQLRQKYPSLSNGYFFSIDCKENYELIRELSAYGEHLLVLSPSNIQNSICQKISKMNTAYKMLHELESTNKEVAVKK